MSPLKYFWNAIEKTVRKTTFITLISNNFKPGLNTLQKKKKHWSRNWNKNYKIKYSVKGFEHKTWNIEWNII